MNIELFLQGLAEDYLVAIFRKLEVLADRDLTNDEMIAIVIEAIGVGAEIKWLELNGFTEQDVDYFGNLEENVYRTCFGEEIEMRSV